MADPAKRGVYKVKMGFVTQHSVRMMFEPYGPFEIAEDHYRQEGYEPGFDTLPWRHEQEAMALAAPGERKSLSAEAAKVTEASYAFEQDRLPLSGAQKPNWFEQSIARLAAARSTKEAPK